MYLKETSQFENKEQTAQEGLENLRRRSKPLENRRREIERKVRTARTRLKEIGVFENKHRTALKRLGSLRTRSKPLERD